MKKQFKVGDIVSYDGMECIVIEVGTEDYDLIVVPTEESYGIDINELD